MTFENKFNMSAEGNLDFIWWVMTWYALGMNEMQKKNEYYEMKWNMLRVFILMNVMQLHVWAQEIAYLESYG